MFEKQFDLVGWIGDLDGELAGTDFSAAIEMYAQYLDRVGGEYREATSKTEQKRELAFMFHLVARLNQFLAAKLVEETPN